MKISET